MCACEQKWILLFDFKTLVINVKKAKNKWGTRKNKTQHDEREIIYAWKVKFFCSLLLYYTHTHTTGNSRIPWVIAQQHHRHHRYEISYYTSSQQQPVWQWTLVRIRYKNTRVLNYKQCDLHFYFSKYEQNMRCIYSSLLRSYFVWLSEPLQIATKDQYEISRFKTLHTSLKLYKMVWITRKKIPAYWYAIRWRRENTHRHTHSIYLFMKCCIGFKIINNVIFARMDLILIDDVIWIQST